MSGILLQTSAIALTDQGIFAVMFGGFGLLGLAIFGAFGFSWNVHQDFVHFKDDHHAWQLEFLKEFIADRDGRKEARRVGLANALEPFVDFNNPFTERQMLLNQLVYRKGIEALTDPEEVEEFIRAWDAHKDYHDPAIRTAAREILKEANAYLKELQAQNDPERLATESQRILAVRPEHRRRWRPW